MCITSSYVFGTHLYVCVLNVSKCIRSRQQSALLFCRSLDDPCGVFDHHRCHHRLSNYYDVNILFFYIYSCYLLSIISLLNNMFLRCIRSVFHVSLFLLYWPLSLIYFCQRANLFNLIRQCTIFRCTYVGSCAFRRFLPDALYTRLHVVSTVDNRHTFKSTRS